AHNYGSTSGRHLHQFIVGMAPTRTGHGYWLVGTSGTVFRFGDAPKDGSVRGRHLPAPIVAIAPTETGHGYWIVGQNGDVFGFGDATFDGSASGEAHRGIVGAAANRQS
ncbi:MAG TPA: hypothetical protein VK771_08545, partial [Acidimicrobiia bacterium]|nr:hypothetical protein [Acidimicrobiia bacterium]